MTQSDGQNLARLTEQIVKTRLALNDAELTAKAAQRQYDQALQQIIQSYEGIPGGSSSQSTGSATNSAPTPISSGSPAAPPSWLQRAGSAG